MMVNSIAFLVVAIVIVLASIALPLANLVILFILMGKVQRIEQKLNQSEP